MKKAFLTKEQAAALESALRSSQEHGSDKSTIIAWKVQEIFSGDEAPLNEVDLDTFIRALYVGYEIEKSSEEKLADIYKNHKGRPSIKPAWNEGVTKGIELTLKTLNIKVPGINC